MPRFEMIFYSHQAKFCFGVLLQTPHTAFLLQKVPQKSPSKKSGHPPGNRDFKSPHVFIVFWPRGTFEEALGKNFDFDPKMLEEK
jgi:hypothetical protein